MKTIMSSVYYKENEIKDDLKENFAESIKRHILKHWEEIVYVKYRDDYFCKETGEYIVDLSIVCKEPNKTINDDKTKG